MSGLHLEAELALIALRQETMESLMEGVIDRVIAIAARSGQAPRDVLLDLVETCNMNSPLDSQWKNLCSSVSTTLQKWPE